VATLHSVDIVAVECCVTDVIDCVTKARISPADNQENVVQCQRRSVWC